MNILIFSYDYSEKSLASSFRARNLGDFCKRNNYNVRVISSKHDNQEEVISIDSSFIENRRFFSKIYLRLFYYPDPIAYWVKKVIVFLKTHSELVENADKIIVTTPPHSLQLIALWIKSNYPNKYVISDFRDAFVTNHRVKWYTPLHLMYAKNMETKIFENIDCIITNTLSMKLNFLNGYNNFKNKIIYVPNGYIDCIDSIQDKKSESITIGYFGDSYGGEISNIINTCLQKKSKSDKIKFLTAGKGDWNIHKQYKKNQWCHLGLVSQTQVKNAIQKSDILIIVMPKGEKEPSPTVPLKVYEYLASDKPVIYFGPKGDCWNLILNYSNTYCYNSEHLNNLIEILNNVNLVTKSRIEFRMKFHFDRIARCIIGLESF
ncbi:hypothetical protein [Acinetobacter sp. YZS-X1-1]|uniref:hypothetical protein n=1 Tax=Acinetobacter sp. YZS-X1-1 TaxID=1501691 RepID=UPI00054CACA7|nr:hypothetical protein [Acinetobacter sp. YZS-X1-1]